MITQSDVIVTHLVQYPWLRHQMETFFALLAFCTRNSPVPVNSPHKGQWRGALMFSLIYAWTNNWVNNQDDGDFRRHRAHYDVSVMMILITKTGAHHPLHAHSTTLIYLSPDGNQAQLKNIHLRYQTGVPICKQNKCFTDKFSSWWAWGLKRPSWRLNDRRPLSNRSQIFRFRSAVDQACGL